MEKSLDEKIYLVTALARDEFKPDKIVAFGLRMYDEEDNYLVGVFNCFQKYNNAKKLLNNITRRFGEARLHMLPGESEPGLICRMKCKGPDYNIGILLDDYKYYRDVKLDLLEMRASDPKPFLSLKYNFRKNSWDYKPILYSNSDNVYILDNCRK